MPAHGPHTDFHHLTYDVVIHQVEEALGVRCTNVCRPMNSYINRVYEVQTEGGEPVIAKFYRPGRWSREALQDEQHLLLELHEQEIPVIPPLGEPGRTLREFEGTYFALFPKKGGRICDEPTPDQWRELGRLLGRVHLVCAAGTVRDRITLTPECATEDQVEYILESGLVADEQFDAYEAAAYDMLDLIEPLFEDTRLQRIHGDLHHQNLICRPGESFYIIDFDDMAVGPTVQDIWMLLPGRAVDARQELNLFLEGYETFRPFDAAQLRLIEPLRAMRFIHFTAWCARQAADGGFTRLAPDWGTTAYWRQEIHELRKQEQEIRDALDAGG
jgi:Ser/Thr protein kinase RdoA (MazF antagonist)